MKWELIKRASAETIRSIRAMDFQNMEISEYNRSYINRIFLHLEYHFKIYENAIMLLLQKKENTKSYFVDFGGGHGFLSLLLKKIGLNVIYCDFNPLSVKTIKLIKETAGYGPDIILEGSSPELLSFCRKSKILPDYLISIDLIEHVYDLDAFFADLHLLNPKMQMLFTTGSNPSNFYKSKKLRKIMIRAEKEDYFHLRKNFIIENFPEISQTDADILAKKTRGLIFPEIKKNIEQYLLTGRDFIVDIDQYNTCDPNTGNWTERILPLKKYQEILNRQKYQVRIKNGFYNSDRKNIFLSLIAKGINFFVRNSGRIGRVLAPYIILMVWGDSKFNK